MSMQSSSAEPQLNATPLIDVMLVLLVILIITLPAATHAVKLDMPREGGAAPPRTVYLDVAYGGHVYWNGAYVESMTDLSSRLVELAAQDVGARVEVVPENLAPYEKVAQVLAAAQRAHISRLGVRSVPDR
ncbi:MAG TPA: biopolymer transporter ExbD [Steroidobacteraceae bacterium]